MYYASMSSEAHSPAPDVALITELITVADGLTRHLDGALSNIKGISYTEYRILAALRDPTAEGLTKVELAGVVGFSPSGVTRSLRPMEKLGFVATRPDGRDARKSRVSLTAEGTELVDDATGVIADVVEALPGPATLSDKTRHAVGGALEALARR